ncbi:MAG: hypothetical protein K2H26_04320 [Ruminococcus sp.]|nr:hypothetical protein [Ruminococcus sp.]
MAIFKNRHYGNFTQIDNAVIHSSLSDKALGALVRLLSHGANWKFNIQSFARERNVGEKTTRTVIEELIKAGHIEEIKERDEKGRYKPTIYNIYETPKTKQENQPEKTTPVKKDLQQVPNVENPHTENPHVDNDGAIPYYSNKEAIKKEAGNKVAEKAEPARLPHGKHQNVFLTDNEYKTLVETYGKEQTDYSIDTLSDFKKKSGKCKKMNDFRQLMDKWIKKDIEWGKVPKTYSSCQVSSSQQKSETSGKKNGLSALMSAVLAGDYNAITKGLKEVGF